MKRIYWLLTVILLQVMGCAHVETDNSSVEKLTETLAGNTIVHVNKRNGFKWFFGQDGKQIFDPGQGFPVSGKWYVSSETQELCWWEVDPDIPTCASIKLHDGQITFYFEDGSDTHELAQGNHIDLTDNPGSSFDPSRELALHDLVDVNIEPPSESLPAELARFSGIWYGTFYTLRDYAIVVENIDGQGADLIYAWGPHKFHDRHTPGWAGVTGYVEGNKLRFNLTGGSITCTLRLDGTMEVVWRSDDEALRSIATRWPDPPWESLASQTAQLTPAQHRRNIERDIAEIYSDYSIEIQQFFVEEAINAGVEKIRAMKPSDRAPVVHPYQVKDCATADWRRKVVVIEVNKPLCMKLVALSHEIAHVGSKCHRHNDVFYKYKYAIAGRYEERFPDAANRRWFAPVQDTGNIEAIYRTKEC
ncbi:MAG: hypothetical protein ACR2QW_14250 [bacterium]